MRPGRAFALSAALLACGRPLEAQTGLPAQPFEAARSNGAFTATLVSSDATRLVVQADDGSVVTFVVDTTSSIPPGLVPGSRVTVRYELADGNRYRVASVGIPKIPLEGGSTTQPPPSPEPVPSVAAEASLEPPASGEDVELEEVAAEDGTPSGGVGAESEATSAATASPAPPSPAGAVASPPHSAPPATAGPSEGLAPGREALVIGGGLAFVAAALGLLFLLRR
jgi:hypothetical protein